jgi:hypothetical protein
METYEEGFNMEVDFGRYAVCNLSKRGDLVSGVMLHVELPSLINEEVRNAIYNPDPCHRVGCNCACISCIRQKYKDVPVFGYTNAIGHVLIESYQIMIGGRVIDKQYGEWLEIWTELTQPLEKRITYNEMIGRFDGSAFSTDKLMDNLELYIPLNFWFCRNIGLSLPLISLFREEVSIGVKFRDFSGCWVTNTPRKEPNKVQMRASLLVDYVFLDVDERMSFFENPQIYLIEQVQHTSRVFQYGNGTTSLMLPFRFPIKELVWFIQRDDAKAIPSLLPKPSTREGYPLGNDHFNFSLELNRRRHYPYDSFDKAGLVINGTDRFEKRKAKWFRLCQPYRHHTKAANNMIYCYSFAERPESHQPTGSMNLSMAEKVQFQLETRKINQPSTPISSCRLHVYAVNYNIFVVEGGMSSMMFH